MQALNINHRAVLAPFIRDGRVDYDAVAAGPDVEGMLTAIADRDVSQATSADQLAFYLNAYNLITMSQVLDRLRGDPQWPGPLSVTDKVRFFVFERHRVAGQKLSLLALENSVIRRRFREPRIHFALNCASSSCPHLPGLLFEAQTLERDLEQLTQAFINSPEVSYDASTNALSVSPLFKWYRRDFQPSVQAFISRYRGTPGDASLLFRAYDWSLNRQ